MSLVIDARTGRPFSEGNAVINLCAQAWATARNDATAAERLDAMDQFRQRMDSQFVQGFQKDTRADALTSGAASFPRDFEHIYNEVLTEKRRPLNSARLWQMDTRVPLGAKKHTVRRDLGTGDAKVWRGGQAVPVVGTQRVEEQFPVIYIVSAVETNWFEMVSNDFQGRNDFENDTRMAIRAINERINDVFFNGDAPSGMHGFFDYPSLAKSVSPLSWTTGGATPTEIVGALNDAANFANVTSGGAFRPNRMATSLRMRNFLHQTRMDSGTDTTIAEFFLRNNEFISTIEGAQEFRGIGPAGEDGIAFYDDSLESTAAVMVQPPTALPAAQIDSFRSQVVYVAAIGGVVMRDVGSNHLLLASAS